MLFFYKAIAGIPAVEPDSCSHLELRIRPPATFGNTFTFRKRFALQMESGYWGEWLVPMGTTKGKSTLDGKTEYYTKGGSFELVMVSTNGKEGPIASVYLTTYTFRENGPLILYNEPVSVRAKKRKKPVVDAHWNAAFLSLAPMGLGKEIQAPG